MHPLLEANPPPHAPGVYLFKDTAGSVIYVGKAKDLKKRVSTYFSGKPHDTKTEALVEKVHGIEYILTHNETEALILESNLIKKYKSRYNIDLKDSVRYPYVRITREAFPRLEVVRAPKHSVGAKKDVFGPFTDGTARAKMLRVVEKHFKLRTCKTLPRRACLKYYMNQCSAPCIANISKEAYAKSAAQARAFLRGDKKPLLRALEREMRALSEKRLFEQALERRDLIALLSEQQQKQVVDRFARRDADFLVFEKHATGAAVVLMRFAKGTLLGKQVFAFDSPDVGADIVEDFLRAHYAEHRAPHKVVVQKEVENAGELEQELSQHAGHPVGIAPPATSEERRMLALVEKNAAHAVGPANPVAELQSALRMKEPPRVMECFDVSHLGGTEVVASMVRFRDGRPDKSGYRKFKISVDANDDFAAMHEAVARRYVRLKADKKEMPDLVVVDGGKGQLAAASRALGEIGVRVPVIALAKREEEVFVPGKPTPMEVKRGGEAHKLLTRIRDEAHRFAVSYQKKRREMQNRAKSKGKRNKD